MKKLVLLTLATCAWGFISAQIIYPEIRKDMFENSDGVPSNMNVYKQTTWTALNTTNNPYPYTGTLWKDLYSDNKTASKKTFRVVAISEERTGGSGTQCIKLEIPNIVFTDVVEPYDTVHSVRLRSQNDIISFGANEGITKYEVTFWARTDGENKNVILNTKNPNTYLTIGPAWKQYTIERYTTGISSTALALDFAPTQDNSDYVVYIDEYVIKQRVIPVATDATLKTSSSFTANWNVLSGATSYSLTVEKVINDGVNPVSYENIEGSPFLISGGSSLSYLVSSLTAGTTYRYKVIASDGTTTTLDSNWITVSTETGSGFDNIIFNSIRKTETGIMINTEAGKYIDLYDITGRLVSSLISSQGENEIKIENKGIYILHSEGNKVKFVH